MNAYNPRMAHSVLGLAMALTALDRAKKRNAEFGEVKVWEDACQVLAQRTRDRILHYAIQSLAASGVGVGASFVRNIVKVETGE